VLVALHPQRPAAARPRGGLDEQRRHSLRPRGREGAPGPGDEDRLAAARPGRDDQLSFGAAAGEEEAAPAGGGVATLTRRGETRGCERRTPSSPARSSGAPA
jgi:hypothetical protein